MWRIVFECQLAVLKFFLIHYFPLYHHGNAGGNRTSRAHNDEHEHVARTRSNMADNQRRSSNMKAATLPEDSYAHLAHDIFHFRNGDYYGGYYRATFPGLIVRQGEGRYMSADRHTYHGSWDHDTLQGKATLKFPDHSFYQGSIENLHLQGMGRYVFPEGTELRGTFLRDRPHGQISVVDPQGRPWRGQAGPTGVTVRPLNCFLPAGPTASSIGDIEHAS